MVGKTGDTVGPIRGGRAIVAQPVRLDPSQAAFQVSLGDAQRRAGNIAAATTCYREAIARDPNLPGAHSQLGVLLFQQGQLRDAADSFSAALRLRPDDSQAHANLGRVRFDEGDLAGAEACFRSALATAPQSARSYDNLGSVLQAAGKADEAIACYRRALELSADDVFAHQNLGTLLVSRGELKPAELHLQRAASLEPRSAAARFHLGALYRASNDPDAAAKELRVAIGLEPRLIQAHNLLGAVLLQQNKLDEARAAFRAALEIDPSSSEVYNNLGLLEKAAGRWREAAGFFDRAVHLAPNDFEIHLNFAAALGEQGRMDEGIAECRRALELNPLSAAAHNNLGTLLQVLGQVDEAIVSYRRAVERNPEDPRAHSNLLYALNFQPGLDPRAVFGEHREWSRRHAEPLAVESRPHANDRTPGRRLRVGYVSPHFFAHAVNSFVEPILAAHDPAVCEVYCYSDVIIKDETTDRLRQHADHWRDVVGEGDSQVADLIRKDRIDILVDLTGHISSGSRLLAFARRPAPVQVTYIGYQNTIGMPAMNYRLSDAWADPPGATDELYTERLIRLPRTFFCYLAPAEAPPIDSLPADSAKGVTFGFFNNFAKVSPVVLAAWAEILTNLPNSRLLVLAPSAASLRRRVVEAFERGGINSQRLELVARKPYRDYLRLIQTVDLALDAFPFNGHTTTCDALWMGVPTVMLAGETYASRFGGTALLNLQLQDFITDTPRQYVERAIQMGSDLSRLRELRATLRQRMLASPLLDAAGFTRRLETAYRQMWSDWCEQRGRGEI